MIMIICNCMHVSRGRELEIDHVHVAKQAILELL